MKIRNFGILLLGVVLLVGAACGTAQQTVPGAEHTANGLAGERSGDVPVFDISDLEVNASATRAEVNFRSPELGFCNVLIGTTSGKYERMMVENMPGAPHHEHFNVVDGLQPDTTYYFKVIFTDAFGNISVSDERQFVTAPADPETDAGDGGAATTDALEGRNVALSSAGATVSGVSSNFGGGDLQSGFGGNQAIDGSAETEWSSDGDGDNAWIEIVLPQAETVHALGFQTRTMGTSAEIASFQVVLPDGVVLGPFDLTGANDIDYFHLDESVTADRFRFEVVTSSGGNTGAKRIELYAR
ncbi:MAG: discoidin domain-containing protein [Thermaerobacterales bacterium]